MITRQQLEGSWNQLKGRLKEKWGVLTDDDLTRGEGNVEQLVGVVQQKTGRAKEEVERFINAVVSESGNMYERAASTAREYADQASGAARRGYDQAREAVTQGYEKASQAVSHGYEDATEMVRRKPVESVAVSFGAGLITGILVAMMLAPRERSSWYS
jgi:uncharacterized protein YjbJ (UPF0337 family)